MRGRNKEDREERRKEDTNEGRKDKRGKDERGEIQAEEDVVC